MKKHIKKHTTLAVRKSAHYIKSKPRLKILTKKIILKSESFFGLNIMPGSRTYPKWLKLNHLTKIELNQQVLDSESFKNKPLISIITPVYNPNISSLKKCLDSVINQTYENWELVVVDDFSTNPEVRKVLINYHNKDGRLKVVFNKENLHISESTNIGISESKGIYIGLLDHDDVLYPNALFENVLAINNFKPDFIYSDEDKISEDGKKRLDPFFKPDWSPDFLRSINYITHFAVIKKNLIIEVGGFRKEYDGAQDWDLFLRTTRIAKNIHHIPKVLYGWRMSDTSTAKDVNTKPYVISAQKNALMDDCKERGYKDFIIKQSEVVKDYWNIIYKPKNNPLISIVIPSKDQYKTVKRCIDSIFNKTTYSNYEIIIVDTGSTDLAVKNWYKVLSKNKIVKIVYWPEQPFSYARSCNEGAKQSKGEYLIMLNNDTEVITRNWIELMLGDTQREGIGSVGVKLFYPENKYIQHAGIGLGLGGYAANLLSGLDNGKLNSLQNLYGNNKRNVACSTAACLMLKKETFNNVGGFSEDFRITYNDVDLGLKILDSGLLNVYNPAVNLTHHESLTLGLPDENKRDSDEFIKAKKLLVKRWDKYIKKDPYLNENFSKDSASFLY